MNGREVVRVRRDVGEHDVASSLPVAREQVQIRLGPVDAVGRLGVADDLVVAAVLACRRARRAAVVRLILVRRPWMIVTYAQKTPPTACRTPAPTRDRPAGATEARRGQLVDEEVIDEQLTPRADVDGRRRIGSRDRRDRNALSSGTASERRTRRVQHWRSPRRKNMGGAGGVVRPAPRWATVRALDVRQPVPRATYRGYEKFSSVRTWDRFGASQCPSANRRVRPAVDHLLLRRMAVDVRPKHGGNGLLKLVMIVFRRPAFAAVTAGHSRCRRTDTGM